MKDVPGFTGKVVLLSIVAALFAFSTTSSSAGVQSGQVLVKAVQGEATYSNGDTWQPLKRNVKLTRGSVVKTGADGKVDLVIQYNGTVLRVMPNSTLGFDKLNKEVAA